MSDAAEHAWAEYNTLTNGLKNLSWRGVEQTSHNAFRHGYRAAEAAAAARIASLEARLEEARKGWQWQQERADAQEKRAREAEAKLAEREACERCGLEVE